MGSLGASGSIVSTVSGAGELLGYALRYVFGLAADRSQRYWTITFIGYILQTTVVPLIAFSNMDSRSRIHRLGMCRTGNTYTRS